MLGVGASLFGVQGLGVKYFVGSRVWGFEGFGVQVVLRLCASALGYGDGF